MFPVKKFREIGAFYLNESVMFIISDSDVPVIVYKTAN